ncbi:MAG TPA: FAD-dependent oxidoreductase [Gemmataceae bacterium]|nr:FAD-dependent oxidoreductase [Gemmataceae bacterium]
MIRERADVAILGAGFAGSVLAMVLRRLGRTVILIERGAHPRFAVGESSTPLANLVLESLAQEYDLPRLAPLAEYGPWQRAYPHLVCGVKRGFTFFQHEAHRPFTPRPDRGNELLVGANPSDDAADTHWFREHVDHFLLMEAQSLGAAYRDRTEIFDIAGGPGDWRIAGRRQDQPAGIGAAFLVDATGPGGALARAFGIPTDPVDILTNSWSIYTHFADVRRFEDLYRNSGGDADAHSYPCDDAALHHVLADGWVFVLRFNNGLVSAGPVWDGERRRPDDGVPPQAAWIDLLRQYPSLAEQFGCARPVRPFIRTGRLQRRARRAVGSGWVLLPHAAYFLDPLFSGGNAHTLLGVERLGRIFRRHWGRPSLDAALADYERMLFHEVAFLDRLIHGSYTAFRRFGLMATYTMYYFAGAIHAEGRRRRGEAGPADEFLFSHDPAFRAALWRAHADLVRLCAEPAGYGDAEFQRRTARDIGAFNPAGLCDCEKNNLYPFV